jgi:endogenous inhibitor of DNA gyrase (YacG/DUF329 family)
MTDRDLDYQEWAAEEARLEAEEEARWQEAEAASQAALDRADAPNPPEAGA